MGKKKDKNRVRPITSHVNRTPREPTAMELAFRQAEARRGKSAFETKSTAPRPMVEKSVGVVAQALSKVANSQTKTTPNSVKASPLEPTLAATQGRKVEVVQQRPSKPSPLNRTPQAPKKTPVKLGLHEVANKPFALSLGSSESKMTSNSSRQQHPEETIAAGRTQLHDGRYADEVDIVMGFDFGTSSSKVIIRDSGRRTAYAFPFGSSASSGNIYLVPTQLYINDDGTLCLSAGEHSCGNIKSRLMADPNYKVFSSTITTQSVTVTEIATGYIAQVIRFARAWFLKHTESIYRKTLIHWHINIGIPSRNYDDVKMRELFRIIAMAAWRISLLPLPTTIIQVKEYIDQARLYTAASHQVPIPEDMKALWLHPDYVNAHPEVITEVVGYARSPLRTNGLHLIVDVGATTLDAATFIIHSSDGEDIFPILATAVERLGTLMLHLNRVNAVKAAMEKSLQRIALIDPLLPLPDLSHYEIGDQNASIADGDSSFFIECCRVIGKTVKDTKEHRDPHSNVWGSRLPVFICGGGGRLSSYRQMIKDMGARCAQAWDIFRGFTIKKIPQPEDLYASDLSPNEYDRLAVAYGLSFTTDEIGEVVAQSKISDIFRQDTEIDVDDRYVSKDMC